MIAVKDIKPTNTWKKYQLKKGFKYPNGSENINVMRTDSNGRAFFVKGGTIHYITHEKPEEALTDELIEALYPGQQIKGSRFFELKTTGKKATAKTTT